MKNLIISAVGDKSMHKEWINGEKRFDLVLIYYGDDENIFNDYKKDSLMCFKKKGSFHPLIKWFINSNKEMIEEYDYIWLPDDDISICCEDVNKFFDINYKYDLDISQPSIIGDYYVSHLITKKNVNSILRYTNFVEAMAVSFKKDILLTVFDDFDLSNSGWGIDLIWMHKYGDSKKIAIIDCISMIHTKPVSFDYSRFKISPDDEMKNIMKLKNISENIFNEIKVIKTLKISKNEYYIEDIL